MAEAEPGVLTLPADLPTRRMERRLYRCVPWVAYEKGTPPTFLHTSGRPGRCNPGGVACLYFSESEIAGPEGVALEALTRAPKPRA